jgi:hypothetical protein
MAALLLLPAAAEAYQVQIQITGEGRVTETTPANLVGSSCESVAGTPTGTVGNTCYAGTTDGSYGWGWDVDYVATPAPGYSFVRWQTTPEHSWSPVICDRSSPAATSSTYTGATCKFKTYENLQTRAVFQDTTPPPSPAVSPAPAGPVNGAVTFNMSSFSDPTFSHFICELSGPGHFSQPNCRNGSLSVNPSVDGTYTLSVRAVDHSGNWSELVQRTFLVDKSPPQTTLAAGVGPVADSVTNSTAASFAFTSSEPGGVFRCELDDQALGTCTSPRGFTGLADGPHRFEVWAVDAAGNADGSPAVRTWTVDTVAPQTTLDSAVGPAEGAIVPQTTATFDFAGSEAGGFRCFLDGVALGTCAAPYTVSGLHEGPHVFEVQAVDVAGNIDPSPAVRRWTVKPGPDSADPPVAPSDPPGGQAGPPPVPGSPTSGDPSGEVAAGDQADAYCQAAKRKLGKARANLRKLKKADAPAARIERAERKVKRLAQAKRGACSGR